MIRLIVVALMITACAGTDIPSAATTEQPSGDGTSIDVWTDDVERDLVDRCTLRGLTECPALITNLREADCTVEGAITYLEGMGMADVRSDVVEALQTAGDCPGL